MVVGGFRSLHVLVLTQKTDSLTFKQSLKSYMFISSKYIY